MKGLFRQDKKNYADVLADCEKFAREVKSNGVYVRRFSHLGFNSSDDRRYTMYRVVDICIATGVYTLREVAQNVMYNYAYHIGATVRDYNGEYMRIAR